LLPGDDEAELSCALSVASLDDDPKYEAVSYVWGPTEDLGRISVALFEEGVLITKNLQSVLRSLRLSDRVRVLWVDALTINQEDLNERANQVTIMGEIYSKAERVLAYLGDHFEGCELAMEAVRQLASDVSPHSSSSQEPGLNIDGMDLDSPMLLDHVCTLLDAPWLTRVWTVQEFTRAKDVVICYGRSSISGALIDKMCKSMMFKHLHCCKVNSMKWLLLLNDWILLQATPRLSEDAPQPPMDVLERFRHRAATDPRDKFYGLRSLIRPDWLPYLPVDYSISVKELYRRVALVAFMHGEELYFLSHSYTHSSSGLPSWIPDWNASYSSLQASVTMFEKDYKACGAQKSSVGFNPDDSMTARGTIISTISRRTEFSDKDPNFTDPEFTKERLNATYDMAGARQNGTRLYGKTSRSVLDACRLSTIGGRTYNFSTYAFVRMHDITGPALFETWEALFSAQSPKNTSESGKEMARNELYVLMRFALVNRCFVLLDNGYFGFAHQHCQPGDVIVALGGGPVPYVLRPLQTGNYTLVGTAYIQDMMDGEAFENNAELEYFTIV
jgi:hypothetical protein